MRNLCFFTLSMLLSFTATASLEDAQVSSCRQFWKESFESEKAKAFSERCETVSKLNWKTRKNTELENFIVGVSFTTIGKIVLQQIIPLWENEKLAFLSTRSPEAARHRVLPETAGLYCERKVYLDFEVPFVAAVATLFHEMTHAMDDLITPERFTNLNGQQKLLASEHRAYRMQDRFLTELTQSNRDLAKVVESAVDHRFIIAFPISEAHFRKILVNGYRIPEPAVDAYFSENEYELQDSDSALSASSSLHRE